MTSSVQIKANELNAIFNKTPIVLMLIDDKGRIVKINEAGVNMIEKEEEEIIHSLGGVAFNCINAWSDGIETCGMGHNCSHCDIRTRVNDSFDNGNEHYKEEGYLEININGEIEKLNLLISTSRIAIEKKKHVLLTVDEISNIIQKKEELEKLNHDKDFFLKVLSHDLKSPFNGLLGISKHLVENIRDIELDTTEKILFKLSDSIENTYKLLEDLVLWSKSKSDLTLNIEKTSFKSTCQQIISEFLSNKKNIQITCNSCPNLHISADLHLFKTVLRNLISNAIKFSHKNSQIIISATQQKNEIIITVSDEGLGIKKEDQERLWNTALPFSTNGTENERGTGLGLLICKEIINKHDGEIWVESTLDKGSDFKFSIPVNNK